MVELLSAKKPVNVANTILTSSSWFVKGLAIMEDITRSKDVTGSVSYS